MIGSKHHDDSTLKSYLTQWYNIYLFSLRTGSIKVPRIYVKNKSKKGAEVSGKIGVAFTDLIFDVDGFEICHVLSLFFQNKLHVVFS